MKKALVLTLVVCLSGCGTLFSSKYQYVSVNADDDSEVYVNGRYVGKGPTTVPIERGEIVRVTAKNPKGEKITDTIEKGINPVSFLNFLGVLWWGIDLATGQAWELDRTHSDVTF